MPGTHWTESDTDALLAVVRETPRAGPTALHAQLVAAGVERYTYNAVHSKLKALGIDSAVDRVAWAAEQEAASNEAKDDGVNITPAVPQRMTRFRQYESASEDYRREWMPQGMYSIDLSNETRPVGLCIQSDQHVGSKYVDYAALREHVAWIAETKGAYLILGGDGWNNHKRQRKSGTALYETIGSNDEQHQWFTDIYRVALDAKKILGAYTGNHEHFDVEESGVHLFKEWCEQNDIPYWGHGGVIRFTVGTQRYYGALRHEYPGASVLNTTNNQRRLIQGLQRPIEAGHLDFACLGHLHFNDLHFMGGPTGDVAAARAGTYALYSEWADQKFGGGRAIPGAPLFVLRPDERDVMAFKGPRLREALDYLTWQRGDSR